MHQIKSVTSYCTEISVWLFFTPYLFVGNVKTVLLTSQCLISKSQLCFYFSLWFRHISYLVYYLKCYKYETEAELYTCIVSLILLVLGNQGCTGKFVIKWVWCKLFAFSKPISRFIIELWFKIIDTHGVYMVALGLADTFHCASKRATKFAGRVGWYTLLVSVITSHEIKQCIVVLQLSLSFLLGVVSAMTQSIFTETFSEFPLVCPDIFNCYLSVCSYGMTYHCLCDACSTNVV